MYVATCLIRGEQYAV